MENTNLNAASYYFNAHWELYRETMRKNLLFHHDMYNALEKFLSTLMDSRPFSFMDVGCGDSSATIPVLKKLNIKQYIGIDAAPDVLDIARKNLKVLNCKKELIAENMSSAILKIRTPVDIIFTSYALHHLSSQEKNTFIYNCQSKLCPNGVLIMIDAVLEPQQSRDAWLTVLENRVKIIHPEYSQDELNHLMEHRRTSDFPEEIETFKQIAKQQKWKNFEVLVNKGIFAFMVFSK